MLFKKNDAQKCIKRKKRYCYIRNLYLVYCSIDWNTLTYNQKNEKCESN